MASETASAGSTLAGIAAILQAIAWPSVALILLVRYRAKFGAVIDIFTTKLRDASHVKAWQIELDVDRKVSQYVDQTAKAAGQREITNEIPADQFDAARTIGATLNAAPMGPAEKLNLAHSQIYRLIHRYQEARATMPSGSARTRVMNEITASMRALSLASSPLLPWLMAGKLHGERLAAICILQVIPQSSAFQWLVERVMLEDQPFVFFQASLAILELVKVSPPIPLKAAREAVERALEHILQFSGGEPDHGTIDVLNEVVRRLKDSEPANA